MRALYTSDLHGSDRLYAELETAIAANRPAVLLLGGDLFPDGSGESPATKQLEYVRDRFLPTVDRWRTDYSPLEVACIAGNHDWLPTWEFLDQQSTLGRLTLLDHTRSWTHEGVEFVGYSRTPPTPFEVKDFERVDTASDTVPLGYGLIWDRQQRRVREIELCSYHRAVGTIQKDLAGATDAKPGFVFICHAPPYSSNLDRMRTVKEPTGSKAVRDFIAARRPSITLHGHIHESPVVTGSFIDKIGASICVNPGQGERLQYVTFDTRDPAGTLTHSVFS